MAFCEQCGAGIPDNSPSCPNCGAQLQAGGPFDQSAPAQSAYTGQTGGYQASPSPYGYAPPVENSPTISVGNWLITMLIQLVPCVNIVMLFVWAFGSSAEPSKRNWARAQLIFVVISVALSIFIGVVFGAIIAGLLSDLSYYY